MFKLFLGATIGLIGTQLPAHAGTITKPYVFNSGDVISSSQMNSDFDTLYTEMNNKDARITALETLSPVSKAGDTMTGALILSADPTAALGAATKQYVDAHAGAASGVSSFNSRTGVVTLSSADVSTALGGLPFIGTAGTSATGALTSSDWNTFNGKIGSGGGTITGSLTVSGTVTASGTLTVSGTMSGQVKVNSPSTAVPTAQLLVSTSTGTNKGTVIQGASSQSGDLTEWQDSGGTVLSLVNSTGNVGIGTTSANLAKLQIFNGTSATPLEIQNTGSPSAVLILSNTGSPSAIMQLTNTSPTTPMQVLQFPTAQSAPLTEWMYNNGTVLALVDSTGNIGIGTSAPTAPLDINMSTAGNAITFTGPYGSGCSLGATSISCSSDIRLKEDIQPISNPLTTVLAAKGVSFHWKKGDPAPSAQGPGPQGSTLRLFPRPSPRK